MGNSGNLYGCDYMMNMFIAKTNTIRDIIELECPDEEKISMIKEEIYG